jgi:transposase
LERSFADKELSEAEVARFGEISSLGYERIGAPQVGYDNAANQWILKAQNAKTPEDTAAVLKKFEGYYVVRLLECDGVTKYSHGGLYEGADETSLRGAFLKDCQDVLSKALLNEAWNHKFPEAAVAYGKALLALETGTHSPWLSRLLKELGHEVLVAHAQKVELITKSNRKDDRHDARTLARLARIDPELLGPVRQRSAKAQIHLTVIRAGAELVSARTALVNAARGLTKSYGERLPKCGTEQVSRELAAKLSAELREVLEPLLKEIESLNERIKEYDARMEKIARESYPQVALLKQVKGVGTQIALTYVLTLDDPQRFAKSREVGCFLGLKPGRRDSGQSQPQMHISKEGDRYLRTMLVQGAHYILGPFGEDSDLRRWGLRLAERGGKNAKKRAVVAVARKLAVLLHRLWVSGEVYEPLRNNRKAMRAVA